MEYMPEFIFAREPVPATRKKVIFLAGPTLRERTKDCFLCSGTGEERLYGGDPDDGPQYHTCINCKGDGFIKLRSWREDAVGILEKERFDGLVLVPEDRGWTFADFEEDGYTKQVQWEHEGLSRADCIAFWVPRDMKILPGLTTNVEFGTFYNSGRCVLGYPKKAQHIRYLHHLADQVRMPVAHTLKATLRQAIKLARKK